MLGPLLALALSTSAARAHQPGLSYAHLERGRLSLVFAGAELEAMGFPTELAALGPTLTERTFARVDLRTEEGPCTLGAPTVTSLERDGVELSAAVLCPDGQRWSYSAPFLVEMEPGHRHTVEAFGEMVAVLDSGHIEARFEGFGSAGAVARAFLTLGVEHIWTGYDHLAFLFALVLVARSTRQMLAIVTGFTLAHSITLSVAALGWLTPPAAVIEPAIAATIAYAGLENLWKPGAKRRFIVTFALGLIHGFGFAGMLRELGMPDGHLAVALLCFNGGVELGQAAVVAIVLPLLLWLRRYPAWEARGVPALSVLVALAGVGWFVERVVA
jgi:hypothetical protein